VRKFLKPWLALSSLVEFMRYCSQRVKYAVTISCLVYAQFAIISRPRHTRLSTVIYFHESITMSSSNIEINPSFTTKAYSANYFVLRKVAQNPPVSQQIPQLLPIIKQHNIVVVIGETGTGKTHSCPRRYCSMSSWQHQELHFRGAE
jgi:HrpA-like RNA helicase